MKRVATDHPDLESIAAYLDGRLTDRARASITEHLTSCEDCYAIFRESALTRVDAETPRESIVDRVSAWFTPPRLAWSTAGTALAAAAAVLLVVGYARIMLPPADAELRALVAAVGTDRPIEGRLAGGFAYGPLRSATRAGEPSTPSVPPDVRIAAAKIEKTAAAHRTPEALESLGIAYLVMGDVHRAVLTFEEATDGPQPNARMLSDLAAAYLARATRNDQPQDFARAATMADRAVKADPGVAEAWFNRACALERLSLFDEARKAWQDYLKIDGTSGWAAEARNRLKALEGSPRSKSPEEERRAIELASSGAPNPRDLTSVIKSSPEAAQRWLDDQMLVEWPRLVLSGRTDDARALASRAQRVADALTRERDDAFWQDVIAAAVKAVSQNRAESLAKGHKAFRAAADAYDADRIAEMTPLVANALAPLGSAGSPLVVAARRYRAIGAYYTNDFQGALDEIRRVQASAQRQRYTRLLGLGYRLEGLIRVVSGDFARALDAYERALMCFQSMGAVEDEAAIQSALAEDLQFVGEIQRSWQARYAGLSLIGAVHDPLATWRQLQSASLAASREDLPELALHFQEAAFEKVQRMGRSPALITAYITRAAINKRLGDSASAVADLDDASRLLKTVHDPLLVSRNEARVLLARGETLARERPAEAIADLDKALAHLKGTRTSWPLASLFLARGRAHLAAQRSALAEADFLSGIETFEQLRSALTSDSLRTSYFEQPWDLFTEMIRLQADRREAGKALMFAERARARTLLEAVNDRNGAVVPASAEIRRRLDPRVGVLYYASLDDRLLIWLLTRDGEVFVSTATRQTEIARLVERWRSDSAADDKTATLRSLYDLLIRPLDTRLVDRTALVIVPDGVLHAVPFAALIRRETGRYLIEHHAVEIAPSLTIFQRAAGAHLTARADPLTSALVIGNPRVDATSAPPLPDAEREARDIATLYSRPRLLVEDDATKAHFTELAADFDVIHFAGHGVSNDDYPALSRLLLAGPDESSRSLFASEISAMRLTRTNLVVLAACRTSAGRIRRGEGVLSLARPFIAAGVPTVVASLWDVDDHASHFLFVAFHRALRRGNSIVDAMREAQLRALAESEPVLRDPANWATFVVIGGASALRDRLPAQEN